MKNLMLLQTGNKYFNIFGLFCIIFFVMMTIILDSNFQMGLIKKNLLLSEHKVVIFLLYIITFVVSGLILIHMTYHATYVKNVKDRITKINFVFILIIYSILSTTLISTLMQIYFFQSYNSMVFYLTAYISFISSIGYLFILSVKFFRWFLKRKNKVVFLFAVLFSLYCLSLLLSLTYLISGLSTHPSIINYVSPRELKAGTFTVNIVFQNYIATAYDLTFLISFLLAWILTTYMLKQYSRRIGKYKFWILVSLPLFFYLIRYEGIIFVHLQYFNILNIPNLGVIHSSVWDAFLAALINSNIQAGGIFFGFSFLPMLLKIKRSQLHNELILVIIGMMVFFASRDFHAIFLNSIPPGGTVTISFMMIGSFIVYIGMASFIKLATRDKEFYKYLSTRIESDMALLKNIIFSEKEILTSKKIKPIIEYYLRWEKENRRHEETSRYEVLKREEIEQIIEDVIKEIREKRTKKIRVDESE